MEEEITKLSLGRYKVELEQKQKFLKVSKKYDEQMKELRTVIGYFIGRLGITNIPDYLKEESSQTISEINVGKEFSKVIDEFN